MNEETKDAREVAIGIVDHWILNVVDWRDSRKPQLIELEKLAHAITAALVERDAEIGRLRALTMDETERKVASDVTAMMNLLAVIHCDGGHYTGEHGFVKSCFDAQVKWHDLRTRAEQAEAKLKETRKLLVDANRGAEVNAHVCAALAIATTKLRRKLGEKHAELERHKTLTKGVWATHEKQYADTQSKLAAAEQRASVAESCVDGWLKRAVVAETKLETSEQRASAAEASYARHKECWDKAHDPFKTAIEKERADKAEQRCRELEKALEPFVEHGENGYYDATGEKLISNADCRSASEALKGEWR